MKQLRYFAIGTIALISLVLLPAQTIKVMAQSEIEASASPQESASPSPSQEASPSPSVSPGPTGQCYSKCEGWEEGCFKMQAGPNGPYTATAPDGQIIDFLYIKSSTSCYLFTEDVSGGCYSITGLGTQTVTVIRTEDSNECKGISHVEFVAGDPETSPSPSASASPSPSESFSPSPSASASPSPSASSSSSPSPSASHNDDDDDDDDDDNNDDNKSVGGPSNTTQEKQGEVLGASTMAGTGNLMGNILNLGQLLGLTLSTIAVSLYGKKNK